MFNALICRLALLDFNATLITFKACSRASTVFILLGESIKSTKTATSAAAAPAVKATSSERFLRCLLGGCLVITPLGRRSDNVAATSAILGRFVSDPDSIRWTSAANSEDTSGDTAANGFTGS